MRKKLTPFQKLVNDVRTTGDPRKMMDLHAQITPQNCSPPVLEALLVHTGVPITKFDCSITEAVPYQRASFILLALEKVAMSCPRSPTLMSATTTALFNHIEDLIITMLSLVQVSYNSFAGTGLGTRVFEANLQTVCNLVDWMIERDTRLAEALYTSASAGRMLLTMWSTPRPDRPDEFFIDFLHPDVVKVMRLYLSNDEGRSTIYDLLFSCSQDLHGFSQALACRMEMMGDYCSAAESWPPTETTQHWKHMTLITSTVSQNATIRRSLRQFDYLRVASSSLSVAFGESGSPLLLPLTASLMAVAEDAWGYPSHSMSRVLQPELVTSLLCCFLSITNRHDKFMFPARSIIADLRRYSFYPRAMEAFERGLDDLPVPMRKLFGNSKCPLGIECRGILAAQTFHLRSGIEDHPVEKPVLCDNSNHLSTRVSRKRGPIKSCSRCRTVVYCSVACHKEDWGRRHQNECNEMRNEYIVFDNSDLDDVDQGNFELPAETYEKNRSRSQCSALERRVDEMVNSCKGEDSRMTLVEIGIANGMNTVVSLVVQLEKIENGVGPGVGQCWRPVQSVSRIIHTKNGLYPPSD
ncbi:hypothetical protein CC1G_12282 [Coprinopsis cinerea okayama7|uniref:MYND-type domain-containing protein n=1 Tax=Coprinopsis cinerea (strain Okayama-7 / 130 / ATCC MYA-4618 / FGSC 9003) TaxID=240176 RepID=A8MZS2_COPC7|nr:hypothetical protein CC1G_12282 [Coprinopsis cinerea okayama7\|eukprot:XP_001828134.2 hypothetical protein CC1G_12282 [Coprinopsis cinerea okayama7\